MQPEFASYLSARRSDAFVFDCFSNPSAEVINERFDAFVDTIRRTHPTTPLIFLQTIRRRETCNFSTGSRNSNARSRPAEAQVRDRMKTDKTSISSIRAIYKKHHIATADERIRPISIYPHARSYRAADPQDTRKYGMLTARRQQRRRSEDSRRCRHNEKSLSQAYRARLKCSINSAVLHAPA